MKRLLVPISVMFMCAPVMAQAPVDFQRDIRPILSDNCFQCHGPDKGKRKAGLRLDTKQGAFDAKGGAAFTPGKLDKSEAFQRISSQDAEKRMPPAKSGKKLTAQQIELVRRWIEQGAKWSEHWAFVAPVRPALPPVADSTWTRHAIDRFVLAKLQAESLKPSPEADRVTLLRRLSLDLIGLPPTIQEVDAVLNDRSPDWYEKQVERLLASPHYGERWGRHWLDAARYSDSDGYEKDKARQVWAYREWVINALNRDLPYDRFIIEQIAGDLLPKPTQDQLVATGFLRNSMINEEGGVDPEQFRMEAMFDRMDALGKSVLGIGVGCAQCHNHKFDPLTQLDYYRMFAFLNNSHEANIAVYTPAEQRERADIFRTIREIETGLRHRHPDWEKRMAEWEDKVRNDQPPWHIVKPEQDPSGGQKHYVLSDGSILAAGYAPTKHTTEFTVKSDMKSVTAVRLELLNDPNLPLGGPGRSIFGLCALTEFKVVAAPVNEPNKKQEIKIISATADVNPPEKPLGMLFDDRSKKKRVTGPIAYSIDGKDETAWALDIGPGRSNVPRKAVFVFEKPVSGASLTFKLVQNHGGWNSDDNQNNNLGRFRFAVTDKANATADPLPANVRVILAIPGEKRTPAQVEAVFSYWRTTVAEWKDANAEIEALWKSHPDGASQLVMQTREEMRPTHLLDRGSFLKPKDAVTPGVPGFLHPLPQGATPNRLTFARWLVDRSSPTTARAIVNRVWQAYFGTGLTATSEDLGSQSETPTHPELFDWLAVEFMDSGWSMKHLHRQIALSATYRQSSHVTPELLKRDPFNRLLARGPRFRVEAEIVRDIALASSGLLNQEIGGASVFPPAPAFLFLPPASYGPKVWIEDMGQRKYRRGMYTFSYRSVPYPALQAFDMPNGDFACVRRARSNTPLQALTSLNEPVFLECARELALRTVRDGGKTDEERIVSAFRRCLSRKPDADEVKTLLTLLNKETEHYGKQNAKPWDLAASDPKQPPKLPDGVSPARLAAWTAVARVLLSLDETITKE